MIEIQLVVDKCLIWFIFVLREHVLLITLQEQSTGQVKVHFHLGAKVVKEIMIYHDHYQYQLICRVFFIVITALIKSVVGDQLPAVWNEQYDWQVSLWPLERNCIILDEFVRKNSELSSILLLTLATDQIWVNKFKLQDSSSCYWDKGEKFNHVNPPSNQNHTDFL